MCVSCGWLMQLIIGTTNQLVSVERICQRVWSWTTDQGAGEDAAPMDRMNWHTLKAENTTVCELHWFMLCP